MKNYRFLALQIKKLCESVERRSFEDAFLKWANDKCLPGVESVQFLRDLLQLLIERRVQECFAKLKVCIHSGPPSSASSDLDKIEAHHHYDDEGIYIKDGRGGHGSTTTSRNQPSLVKKASPFSHASRPESYPPSLGSTKRRDHPRSTLRRRSKDSSSSQAYDPPTPSAASSSGPGKQSKAKKKNDDDDDGGYGAHRAQDLCDDSELLNNENQHIVEDENKDENAKIIRHTLELLESGVFDGKHVKPGTRVLDHNERVGVMVNALEQIVRRRWREVWIAFRMGTPFASTAPLVARLGEILSTAVIRSQFYTFAESLGYELDGFRNRGRHIPHLAKSGAVPQWWYRWRMHLQRVQRSRERAACALLHSLRAMCERRLLVAIERMKQQTSPTKESIRDDVEEVIALAQQCWIGMAPQRENPQAASPDLYQSVVLRSVIRRKRQKTLSLALHKWFVKSVEMDHHAYEKLPVETFTEACQTSSYEEPINRDQQQQHQPSDDTTETLSVAEEEANTLNTVSVEGEHQFELERLARQEEEDEHLLVGIIDEKALDERGSLESFVPSRGKVSALSSLSNRSYFTSLEAIIDRTAESKERQKIRSIFMNWRLGATEMFFAKRIFCSKLFDVVEVEYMRTLYQGWMGIVSAGFIEEQRKRESEISVLQSEIITKDEQILQEMQERQASKERDTFRHLQSFSKPLANRQENNYAALQTGAIFAKFQWSTGRNHGARCRKFLTVHRLTSREDCYLTWCEKLEQEGGNKRIMLRECINVSYTFQNHWKRLNDDYPWLCFTLVTQFREVHLCAFSFSEFLTWFMGLQSLCKLYGLPPHKSWAEYGYPQHASRLKKDNQIVVQPKVAVTKRVLIARYIRRKLAGPPETKATYAAMWKDAIARTAEMLFF